jgi:DNA-binding SARP family transcriptional activator
VAIHQAQLRLDLLGPPQVCLGDRSLTFPTRKTLALLIYLAMESGQQPRDLLATMLWPESSQERSYASLRNTLGHLRSALSKARELAQSSCLSVTHNALALNLDTDILVDLKMVERAYAQARADRSSRSTPEDSASLPLLQEAASCYRGDFLAGFSLGDAPGFDDWVDIQREMWRRRLGLILDRLSEIQFARGEFGATAETASLWITLDALNEVAYRRKMRAHFAAGERGQALETYEACRAILAAELRVEPEPDTEALAARIRSQHPLQRPEPHLSRLDTPVAFLENLFSGRAAEHQALVEHYKRSAAGQLQVVVLRGEAGIGKTLLAQRFLAWVVDQGAETLEGHAFESSHRMSYQPLIEALRPLLAREDAPVDLSEEARLAPLSYLLPELRERYPEFPAAYMEIDGGRTQLFEALVHLTLVLASRSPVVLFIDDLQWVDNATLDWLVYATRRWQDSGVRIMLLVSLRSEALQPPAQLQLPSLSDWLARVGREIEPFHLELRPLGERDTVEMILSILATPATDFAEWLFNETQGQPFYLKETLKDLLERRALHPKRRAADQWVFEVDAEHDLGKAVRVPSTVRAVILSRLNRLSPNAFALLVAGAVLELRLTFERLCAVSNVAEDAGLPALDELVSGRLLLEVAEAGAASTYTFTHNMIRDVVYTEAGDARRRLFHRRALEVLEAAGDSAAVLAHHALSAGLAEPAFRYSLDAGQEALRLSVASEAIAHFEQARQLVRDASLSDSVTESDLHTLFSQLGRAYEQGGRRDQAQAVYDELASLTPRQP